MDIQTLREDIVQSLSGPASGHRSPGTFLCGSFCSDPHQLLTRLPCRPEHTHQPKSPSSPSRAHWLLLCIPLWVPGFASCLPPLPRRFLLVFASRCFHVSLAMETSLCYYFISLCLERLVFPVAQLINGKATSITFGCSQ